MLYNIIEGLYMQQILIPKGEYYISKNIKSDLVGQKFNKLTVLEYYGHHKNQQIVCWLCQCECGQKCVVRTTGLTHDHNKSCGKCKRDRPDKGSKNTRWTGYENISGKFWHQILRGAKYRNHEINITIEDAWNLFNDQDQRCALTGIKLVMNPVKNSIQNTASLDRIDNNKGYIKGNVQWVHKDINFMKQDLSQEEFINYCKMVSKKFDN